MKNNTKNGQSAAKSLSNNLYEKGSTTIETTSTEDKGVEYTIKNSGKGRNLNNSYIYIHTRLDKNEVFYVGIGTNKNNKFQRAYSKHGRNKYWKNITNITDYEITILKTNMSIKLAHELEKILISYYGRKDLNKGTLCNMTDGGEGHLGALKSQQTIEKLINSLTGQKRSLESRKKISESKKGIKFSKDHKNNLSKALIGRKLPKEVCEKMGKSRHKKVNQYDLSGNYIKTWDSLLEASKFYKCHYTSISHCCRGRKKSVKGFNWEYSN